MSVLKSSFYFFKSLRALLIHFTGSNPLLLDIVQATFAFYENRHLTLNISQAKMFCCKFFQRATQLLKWLNYNI